MVSRLVHMDATITLHCFSMAQIFLHKAQSLLLAIILTYVLVYGLLNLFEIWGFHFKGGKVVLSETVRANVKR